jgi:hypothetical protein
MTRQKTRDVPDSCDVCIAIGFRITKIAAKCPTQCIAIEDFDLPMRLEAIAQRSYRRGFTSAR